MIKNYLVVSLALLAIVPFLVMDVSAQSPTLSTISPPDDYFDLYADIIIISNTSNTTGYTRDVATISEEYPDFVAHRNSALPFDISAAIYFSHPIPILSNPIFSNINDEMTQCVARVLALKDIFTIHVQGFDPPDNITPNATSSLVGLGLDFYNNTDPTNDTQCSPNFETPSSDPLFTGKELLITIYQKSDKTPYYFSPRDNILEAQPIPACSSTNFNETDQTLKGDNSMCYGVNSTSMVIITKRLAGFYGAADTVTPPTNPVNLTIGAPSPDPPLPAGTIKIPPPSGFPSGEPGGKVMRLADFSQNVDKQTAQYIPYAFPDPGDDSVKRQVTVKPRVGEVFVPGKITLITNPLYRTINLSFNCYDIPLTNLTNAITIPNIQPSEPIGLGYVFDDSALCKTVYNLLSDYPTLTDTELRVTLYGKYDKTPYYFSPRDNMTQAQSIPACSSTNFNTNNQTLKGDTKMCHGVNGTNMVIITKRFGGFYGAADTVTAPTNPLDLDSAGPSLAVTTSKEDVSGIGTSNIFNITSGALGSTYYNTALIDTHGKYTFAAAGTTQKGHIYISPNTLLTAHPNSSPFKNSDIGKDCVRGYVTSTVHADHDLPDDISEGVAYGFAYTNGTDTCNYNSNSMARQFDLDTPFRIVLYDQAGKQAYSYLPAAGITTSQDIVECSSASFDDNPKIPLDSTTQCYEDVGDDLVIYSRVIQWYGAKTPSSGTPDPTDPPLPAGTIKIPPPDGFPTQFHNDHIIFTINTTSNTAQMTNPKADVRGKTEGYDFGDIFVQNGTRIVSNPAFDTSGQCNFVVDSIYGFVWSNRLNTYPLPTNVQPNLANGTRAAIDEIVTVGFNEKSACRNLLHNPAAPPLITDKELRVTIYDEYDKKPYFYSKRANMTEAQQIPACSSTNYDSTTQTLKDDTKMCAGVNGTNMVIITKRFTGFYGAADTITTPATPIDLDAGGPPDPAPVTPPVTPVTPPDPTDLLTISGTIPDPVFTSTTVISDAGVKTGYITTSSSNGHTFTHTNILADRIGSIFVPHEPRIPSNDIFTTARSECDLFPIDIKTALDNNYVTGLAIPDNIKPKAKTNLVALGFDMRNASGASVSCSPDLESNNNPGPLLLDKALYITLSDKSKKAPYYISPRDNITSAQQIAACSSTNYDTAAQTLKGATEMCYGKNGTDMVILTKRLAGFYGAANSVTAVSSPDPSTPDPSTPDPTPGTTDPTSRYNVKGIGTNPLSDGLFNITTSAAGNGSIDASGKYSYIASGAKQKGHIYIAPDTIIYDDLFVAADVGKTCVQGHVIPSDYSPSFSRPSDVSDGTAYGFAGINGPDSDTCTLKLSHLVGQLNTSKTFQVVLYDQAGKVGYYYLRSIGINTAQDIAECSSTIFDNSTKTLKGTTRYCYKDVGGDLVIYAKVIQMYGAKTAGDTGANINTVSRDDVYGIGVNTNFNITTSAAGNGSIDTFGKYTWSAVGTQPKGHIYIPPDTIIYDDLFVADDVGKTCMQGRVIPSDYSSIISRPSDLSDGTAYGFLYLVGADSDTCTLKNTAFIGQFNTSNTLQVVLYDQAGKEGYYYHPGININTSQDMTKCSSTIFDDTTKTFKGTTKHCYADVGDDLVIYTKVLLWYGAKTPSTPDLLSIPKPSNFPQLQPPYVYVLQTVGDYGTLSRFQAYIVNGSYFDITDNDGVVLQAKPDGTVGNVYISGFTLIDNYTVTSDPVGSQCSVDLWSLSDLINKDLVPSFTIPDNISPSDQITGLGFDFNATNYSGVCKTDVESSTKHLTTRLDLRFTIYDSTGKQPYYFSPRENIVQARPIDPCTTDTIYTSNYTLKNTTEMCYGKDGNDLVILTKRLAFYGVEGSGDDGNSDSTDDDGDMANAPTFGTSPLTGEQLVTCGYKMDDTCRDITAYHVQYERDVIQTNTTHTFALKALAPNMIDSFTLAFGVPEVGSPVSAAEAYITAKLAVNYTSPSYYNIVQVTVHDPNNIIDYDIANTEIARVSCSGGTLECAQVTFSDVLFRETLYHEPFVVMITDTLLYTSINYMNEGILVTGTPLNEQPTISPGITVDTGDTRPTKLVLVRTDKVNDLWADAFGNTWSRNSFGNYVIVEYAPYAGTVPVCSDINDRLCAPFKAKLDWHNQRMIELRDSLYTAYTTKAYAEIDDIFTYEFGDMDSRTRTLINLGWLTE